MNNFTLRQLRYVDALARHGHFGHAAEACSVSQPALSMQIKELEAALGAQLFERSTRQVWLTQIGKTFASHAHEILARVEELEDLTRASHDQLSGTIRIGVIPTIAPYLLPKIIRNLKDDFPRLDLNLRETVTPRLIEELLDGRLDGAIVALPISQPSFQEVAMFEESFVLVRPTGDADLPVPDPDLLREMRLLLLEEGHCFRDQALAFCSMKTTRPREILDGSSLSTLVQMVGAGIGVTLIPEMAIEIETRAAPVAVAPFNAPEPSRTVGMIWRKTTPLIPQLTEIAGAITKIGNAAKPKLVRP